MGTKNFSNYSDMITFSRASTGTYLDSDGLLKSAATNTPRVEYDYQGNRLGLLVEEARTNLVTYSEDFTVSAWLKTNSSIENVSGVTLPNGSTSANKLIWDNGATTFGTVRFAAADRGTATNPIVLYTLSGSGSFTITNGAGVPTIEKVGDWYRCSLKDDSSNETMSVWARPAGFDRVQLQFYGNSRYIYVRDSVATQGDGVSGIYLWGAQLEAGSFPTSYIPTSGATATRSADVASIGVGAFGYNKGAGTVLITLDSAETADFPGAVAFNGNSGANRWYLYSSAGTWAARQFIDNVSTGTINLSAVEASAETKLALALKGSSASAVKDGGSVVNNATFPIPPLIDEMEIGDGPGGVTQLNGHISSIAYYPRRLTDAQIKALTSPPETPTLSLTFDDSSTSYLETSIHG